MLTTFDIRELILLFPEYIPPNNQYMIKIKKKKFLVKKIYQKGTDLNLLDLIQMDPRDHMYLETNRRDLSDQKDPRTPGHHPNNPKSPKNQTHQNNLRQQSY